MKLSERYDVNSIDAKCDGWNIAKGFDSRLGRPVLVAAMSSHYLDRYSMDEWLARRVSVSHAYVAELFDGLPRDDAFYCVFESRKEDVFGLPDLSRYDLLSAFVKIADAVEELLASGVRFRFSEQQIIWDGMQPHLLGLLPQASKEPHVSNDQYVATMTQFFGSRLQQRINQSEDPNRVLERSAVLRMGLLRLQGEGTPCTTFADVKMVLEAMLIEEQRRKIALQAASSQSDPDIVQPIEKEPRQEASMETIVIPRQVAKSVDPLQDSRKEVLSSANTPVRRHKSTVQDVDTNDFDDEEDEFDQDETRSVSRSRVMIILVVSVLVAIGIIYGGVSLLRGGSGNGASAQSSATPAPKTTVTSTTPASLSVTGLSAGAAIQLLATHGFHSVTLQSVTLQGSMKPGAVIASSPSQITLSQAGSSVTLQVAVPQGDGIVPNIKHLSLQSAEQQLLADHFHYSYVIQHVSGGKPGLVSSQTPIPYQVQPLETNVAFVVAQNS
ncbi:hypothetical protein [Sulfoacidibacillus ferrooxidans]|uniref:PASTA domain-containing protein n=1 Tax=Sulfoacidibacillus ferrooxidans TaxID=2005001 RepID=A0A9X1VCK0_9BACL|nr:hypothetical protein [Sulfoacidibacillus ferrooxidans]MCI0183562.1 hypothetical protein [Sulfoacidibacillus ferrooxidans]